MRFPKSLLAMVMLAVAATALPATAQEVSFGGQVRPRFELRDPAGDRSFTSMRIRAHMSALVEENLRIFIQFQDVRFFGEETSTLGDFSADNLDLHQGFVDVGGTRAGGHLLRIGRQEVNFGGQRLVGAVGWTQQGRSFDGARFTATKGWGSLDLTAFQLGEETAASSDEDAQFFGAHAAVDHPHGGALDLYGLYNRVPGDIGTDQMTLGARFTGSGSSVTYRGEFSYQFGDRTGLDVSAFMFGGRVGTAVGDNGNVTLWYDYLSGDDDPSDGETKVFDTLFATNHKFYGFADLFLNIPAHTGGQGLQDIALKGALDASDAVRLSLDIHSFLLAEKGMLDSSHLGEEVDLTVSYRHSPHLTIQGGLSQVFQSDAWAAIGRLDENMTWLYLMLNATL